MLRPVYDERRTPVEEELATQPETKVPNVSVGFSNKGFEVRYELTQRQPPRAYVGYAAVSNAVDDQIIVLLRRPMQAKVYTLSATVNPLGKCSTRSYARNLARVHDQCSTSDIKPERISAHPNCGEGIAYCWSGKLIIPYDALAANGLSSMEINVERTLWGKGDAFVEFQSEPDARNPESRKDPHIYDRWLHASITTVVDVESEQYVTIAPTFGSTAGAPPHRITSSLVIPAAPHTFAGVTLADASGSLLTLRDKSLKSILPADQVKDLKCVSCASYQTDAWSTAWAQPVVAKAILPMDFSKLGVDTAPFSFDAVGYPVDAGFKLIGGGSNTTVAFASMNGLTPKNGSANDDALAATGRFGSDSNALVWGLYRVDANRTISTVAGAPAADGQHTHNTEASLGFTSVAATSNIDDRARSTGTETTFATLLRYGSQHVFSGERIDAAMSVNRKPAFIAPHAANRDRAELSATLGFRSLGMAYRPLDGDFDPIAGLRGYYGGLQFAQQPGSRHPIAAQIVAHRFSDGVEPRDTALTGSLSIRLSRDSPLSLTANATTAQLAVSQVTRLLRSSVPLSDAAGRAYLPNGSFSGGVAYTQPTFEMNVGYAQTYAQNCRADLGASPCYAYRQPSATGGIFWRPIKMLFLDGSIQSQNNEALGLPGTAPDLLQRAATSQQTTAGHIVRKAAVGVVIPHLKCSTFAFTTENRGGDVDAFAATPPQPGFTNTTSLELAPSQFTPGILVAYSRQGTPAPSTSTSPPKQFFVRLLFGLPGNTFLARTTGSC